MGSKKKRKQNQNQNKGLFVQWGVPVTVLVIVIIFLISNFTITSKNSAQETINKQLTSEIEAYASALKSEFYGISGTASGAASVIAAQGFSENKLADYASAITRTSGNIYMTVITDRDGKGVSDTGTSLDMSGFDYYNINNSVKYSYVKDNGITGTEAFVCATPIAGSDGMLGMIYMFINPSGVTSSLPINNYGGGVGYALITPNGDILYTTGSPSTFTGGDNLFTNLEGAGVEGLTIAQIKLRAEKQNRMIFSSTKGTESKTLASAPIFVDGWQLMAALNQKYVDKVVYSEMKNARKMITNLAIAIGVFLLFLVANAIINKIKYGEESKDLADKADTDLLTELNNKMATERKIQDLMN